MAGGKETPRQKMVGMMYLVLTALLALNVSKSILDAFVAIEENIQIANETEVFRGNAKRSELKEKIQDQTAPAVAKKAARLYKIVQEIDKITAERIKEIDGYKLEILSVCGEDVTSVGAEHIIVKPYDAENTPLAPIRMNLEMVEGKDNYDVPVQVLIGPDIKKPTGRGIDMWKNYIKFRTDITQLIAAYPAGEDQKPFFFKAPIINEFKNQADLSAKLNDAIEKQSNVNIDDKEMIKKIYSSLTKKEKSEVHGVKGVHWIGKTFDHSPNVAALASLTSIQKEILAARADAVALIRQRVGGGDYSFNKVMALAYGPELANAGDEVQIEVLMAAFDSDKQPKVTVDGVTVEDVKDGKGYVKVKAQGASEMVVKGTITIMKKSGIPQMKEWEKTIKIMKPMGTVSLPELNVLYRGYPNVVDAVASGYEKTILTGAGGVSLSPSGTGWIASPGNTRECTLTVSGKTEDRTVSLGSFKFRVMSLPDPELYFGASKSGERGSKNETNLFAKYPPEIPLNAAFKLLSWELIVPGNPGAPPRGAGSKLTPDASKLLRQARPGSVITFITTVRGPDNIVRKKAGSYPI
jgi:gliding motility-associated protein GldM